MIIHTSVKDLLLLFWNKKHLIFLAVLLFGLGAVPAAQLQHDYVRGYYEDSRIRSSKTQEDEIKSFITASVFIIGLPLAEGNKPVADIIHVLKSNQIQYAAKARTIEKLEMPYDNESYDYLNEVFNGATINFLEDLQIINIVNLTSSKAAFETLVESLMKETQELLAPNYKFSWLIEYSTVPVGIGMINENYMVLPARPNAYIRVIGGAMIAAFVLVCVIFLIIDFARPVIKGINDANINLKIPAANLKNLNKVIENKSCVFYAAGKIKHWEKHCATFKNAGISTSKPGQEDLVVICVKAFSTTYEDAVKALKNSTCKDMVLLVL